MEIPGLSKFVKPSHNYLVPVAKEPQPEPQEDNKALDTETTRQQLVDQFITATQNPPPGPGGILGISGPFDEPPPYETPEEYRARPHLGTIKPFRHVRDEIDPDIERAKRRGAAPLPRGLAHSGILSSHALSQSPTSGAVPRRCINPASPLSCSAR